jgi:Bacterial regulatory proteins, luxR family
MTQKEIAFEFGISINTVGNLAANAYRKLGVHGAAAAVHAHRDAHFYCGTRVDFGPIRERLEASQVAKLGIARVPTVLGVAAAISAPGVARERQQRRSAP